MRTATCHCGAVKIEMSGMPDSVTQCTCSICRRYGARWAYCTRKTAIVTSAPDATTAYLWGDREIEFHHCRICGCLTHYESVEKTDDSRIAVNARMLPPGDMEGVRIRTFDGADTWKYLD
jgi:hypothetical protein